MKHCISFIASLLVHVCVLLYVLKRDNVAIPEEGRLVTIEVAPFPGKESLPVWDGRVPHKAGNLKGASGLSLKDLGIPCSQGEDAGLLPGDGGSRRSLEFAFGSGGGGSVLEQVAGAPVYEEIYERIESVFDYPEEFRAKGIEGSVRATLVFDGRGKWSRKDSTIRSSSPYLRVYVVRLLKRLFAEPIPRPYPHGKNLKVECLFELNVRGDSGLQGVVEGFSRNLLGNFLSFSRSAKGFAEWELGPLHGYGIVPSVGIDPMWFVDQVKKIRGVDRDPLVSYRDDPEWTRDR